MTIGINNWYDAILLDSTAVGGYQNKNTFLFQYFIINKHHFQFIFDIILGKILVLKFIIKTRFLFLIVVKYNYLPLFLLTNIIYADIFG